MNLVVDSSQVMSFVHGNHVYNSWVLQSVFWFSGNTMCWIDPGTEVLECSDLNGGFRYEVTPFYEHAFDLEMDATSLYISSWRYR